MFQKVNMVEGGGGTPTGLVGPLLFLAFTKCGKLFTVPYFCSHTLFGMWFMSDVDIK